MSITMTEINLFKEIADKAIAEWGFTHVSCVAHNNEENPDFEHFKIWGFDEKECRYKIVSRWTGLLEEI